MPEGAASSRPQSASLKAAIHRRRASIRAGLAATPEEGDFTSAQRRIEARREASSCETGSLEKPSPDAQRCVDRSRPAFHSTETGSLKRPSPDAQRCVDRSWPAFHRTETGSLKRPSPDAHLSPLPLNEQTAQPGSAPSESPARCSDRGFLPMALDEYLKLLDWTGRQVVRGKWGAIPAELAPILDRLQIAAADWLELAVGFGRLFHRVAGRPESVAWQRTRRAGRFRPGRAGLLGSAS